MSSYRQTEAVQAGLTESVNVPLKLITTVSRVWQPLTELAKCGNVQTKSDIQVYFISICIYLFSILFIVYMKVKATTLND